MVKLDPKRNYYADLEVAPDADADEIRKQFRKLALKWHPDRNPGKEGECVPRFQAIQAAHEILGDPVERQKYDVERRKRGFYATQRQPAPRGNPYQATSNFPPPPRRTGRAQPPPRADYASTAGTASSGANRFTNFPRPPPTAQRKDNAAEAKANVFNAWQNMKTKQNASSHAHTQSDATGRMPKSAWEAANEGKPGVNRSQSTRASKRPGFDPATPGADEPPAASTSAYFRTSNYGRPVPPPPPPPRDANAPGVPGQPVDPMRQFRETLQKDVPFSEGSRIRTPYGSSGGERTFIDPVRRSASQRSSPHRAPGSADSTGAFQPGGSTARHHSSSPPRRKGNATRPFSLYPSSDEEDMAEPTRPGQPQANAQSGAGMNGFSNQTFNTESNANNANGGMGQKSKSSMYDKFFPLHPQHIETAVPEIRMEPKQWPYWAIPSSLPPRSTPSHSAGFKKRSATNNISSTFHHRSQRQRQDRADNASSFTFPIDSDTFAQTPDQTKAKSKSAEGINTKFSPGDWHGKFEGKPDYFSGPINPSNGRSRKSPNRPPSAAKNRTPNAAFGAPPMPTPPADQPAASPSPTAGGATAANTGPFKFSQEEWLESLKDPSFIFPTKPPKSTSPTKGPAPMRGRKQSRSRTTTSSSTKPKPASVVDADEESNESASSANEAATADSPMAMDIDPEPSQPATNGTTYRPKIVPTSISQARAAQREQARAQAQSQAQGTGVEGASIRLDDLRNVAPFTTTSQEGLENLNDLTQNLPFDSRASAAHPTRSSEPSLLRLPELPKAPELPQRLTMSAWQELLPKMATYVRAFHQFDSHMLQRFAARQRETDAMGTPANWLGAMGDTTAGGFGSYMRGIKEDERARMHWKVAWEWHRTAMELFEGCRARVLKGNLAP